MARRSIEMYEYRQALMRMRQGDSEREIARSKLMGRSKAARFRELAHAQGWLDPARPVPTDAEIAAVLGQPRLPVSAQSSIAAYRTRVEQSGFALVPLKTWTVHGPGIAEPIHK